MGDGRTYASAARNPGELVSSGGASVRREEMEGVFNFAFRFPGLTVDSSENSFLVLGPDFGSRKESDDNEADESLRGVGGIGERGKGRSSSEKIERSSPFHWSPK